MIGIQPFTLRTNRLLAALEPDDFGLLAPELETVELKHRQVIYDTGATVRWAYFPHDAIVSLVNGLENGSTVEVAVFGHEGGLGLLSRMATHQAFGRYVVQVPGTASRIPIERLNEVEKVRPNLRRLVLRYGEVLLTQTFQTLTCHAVHSVEARCCRWFLAMHDRLDQDTLPLTHEFLSGMLGVQRSTVSVAVGTLQAAGLVRQYRGEIAITNRTGLEAKTCECYGRIRMVYERLLPGTYPRTLPRSTNTLALAIR
jgi:CRP-like cAMP-binding protein